jgi:hypothetical protein
MTDENARDQADQAGDGAEHFTIPGVQEGYVGDLHAC